MKYTNLSTQKITGDANQPTVAIDVVALGGKYGSCTTVDHSDATTYVGGSANITATNSDVNHTGAYMQVGPSNHKCHWRRQE